ncbi:hypothetical protein O4A46_24870 [Cupriavidus gilardii]|uniref:hypothetical protein n=1 Tax=Cupriavidus gilardii TaxID=82541 RepID=UPI00352EE11E
MTASGPMAIDVATDEGKFANVGKFDVSAGVIELAEKHGLDLGAPPHVRLDRAARNMNFSAQYMLAAGLDLLSVRSECDHGQFLQLLEARGFAIRSAYRAIAYAQFVSTLPTDARDKVLSMPKSKVSELAKADPEVLQELFEDDTKFDEMAGLSVRELRLAIRDANAKLSNLATQNETLSRQRDRLQDELREVREGRVKTGGAVPILVQDIRLECAALHKKALISVEDIGRLASEHLANGLSENAEWNVPVARHVHAALASLYATVGGLMAQMEQTYGPELAGDATVLDTFSPEEATRCALEYRALIAEHEHEKKAREWEREMERPRGVGRPKKRPV